MKKTLALASFLVLAAFTAGYAFAAPKTYQWELARGAGTKVTGDLKVGAKVTVTYTMTATGIEVKPEAAAKATKKKK